jgi:hypothetical protein
MRRVNMRSHIIAFVTAVFLAAAAACSAVETWIAVSTEVGEELDGTGFRDRHALKLDGFDYTWPGSIFFDPGDIIDLDTGLDAYHYVGLVNGVASTDVHYFATEVDFWYQGAHFEDEDLLMYNTSSGLLTEVFDVKNLSFGPGNDHEDFGLDAASLLSRGLGTAYLNEFWAFSTEVGGVGFSDGDILITDGTDVVDVIPLACAFGGRNVGLDAIHYLGEGWYPEILDTTWALSTEVDGWFYDRLGTRVDFRDEDILVVDIVQGAISNIELVWLGREAFGRDVGLDALYGTINFIPEPTPMLMLGLAFAVLGLRHWTRK